MSNKNNRPVKIGLIFSTTGTTSIVEEGQLQACLLGIDEVNNRGNIRFKAIIEDIKSNPQIAAEKAHKLLTEDHVDLLIGCWTSACRKAVLPVLEETGGLLLYPNNYEGLESHPQVFYLGAVPNQQVESILSWVVANLASRFILLGSDYIYPRSANQQVRQWVERIDPEMIIHEQYFPLGHSDFGNFIHDLSPLLTDDKPVVIVSNLVGSSVVDFYRQYHQAGFNAPIISPITSEREIAAIGSEAASGHYCTSGYFQALSNEENKRFISHYYSRFGETTINGAMEFAYDAIRLLEQTYDQDLLKITEPQQRNELLRERLKHQSLDAPQGKLIVDPQNQHLWLWSRIGKIKNDSSIDVVWESAGPIPPYPFSDTQKTSGQQPAYHYKRDPFNTILGRNPKLRETKRVAEVASKTRSNVLLEGETGCGKCLFAKAIHQGSILANEPFVEQPCAGFSEVELQIQLFGDASGKNPGALELANGGTLLLKNIGELPLTIQQQLLDTLQKGQLLRHGEEHLRPLEIRIISTTTRDLLQEIAFNGTFLSDLFNHLAVFTITLPALREFSDDIPELCSHFLRQLNQKNSSHKQLAAETITALMSYSWPGNIHELIITIERAFYLSLDQEIIRLGQLPAPIANSCTQRNQTIRPVASDLKKKTSPNADYSLIEQAIRDADYNMSQAAKQLGISRSTLYRKIEKLQIKLKAEIVRR